MLPCNNCKFKENIPGDMHIECRLPEHYSILNHGLMLFHLMKLDSNIISKWFNYPINYDPVWGPSRCAFSNIELTDDIVREPNTNISAFIEIKKGKSLLALKLFHEKMQKEGLTEDQ